MSQRLPVLIIKAMWSIALALVSLALGQEETKCYEYRCDPPGFIWPESACSVQGPFSDNLITVKSNVCTNGQVCDIEGIFGYCVEASHHRLRGSGDQNRAERAYRGEPCRDSTECINGVKCIDGKCESRSMYATCGFPGDCSLNSTCWNGHCHPLAGVGEACMDHSHCVHNAGCDRWSSESIGRCVEYLSLSGSRYVESYQRKNQRAFSPFCESTLCSEYGNCLNSFRQGLIKDEIYAPIPYKSHCIYDWGDARIFLDMECGNDGKWHCPLLPDHELMQKYLTSIRQYLNSTEIRQCSPVRRTEGAFPTYMDHWCAMETYKPSQGLINDYYRAARYVQVMNTGECVRKLLLPLYQP